MTRFCPTRSSRRLASESQTRSTCLPRNVGMIQARERRRSKRSVQDRKCNEDEGLSVEKRRGNPATRQSMPSANLNLFGETEASTTPPGFEYRAQLIDPAEESALVGEVQSLDFAP